MTRVVLGARRLSQPFGSCGISLIDSSTPLVHCGISQCLQKERLAIYNLRASTARPFVIAPLASGPDIRSFLVIDLVELFSRSLTVFGCLGFFFRDAIALFKPTSRTGLTNRLCAASFAVSERPSPSASLGFHEGHGNWWTAKMCKAGWVRRVRRTGKPMDKLITDDRVSEQSTGCVDSPFGSLLIRLALNCPKLLHRIDLRRIGASHEGPSNSGCFSYVVTTQSALWRRTIP